MSLSLLLQSLVVSMGLGPAAEASFGFGSAQSFPSRLCCWWFSVGS